MLTRLVVLSALGFGSTALAADIEVLGSCPGPVTVTLSGLTPGGQVYVAAASEVGSTVIPRGPCAGVDIGLGGSPTLLGPFTDTDFDGVITRTPTIGPALCGKAMVVVDIGTCTVSGPTMPRFGAGCSAGETNAWPDPSFEAGGLMSGSTTNATLPPFTTADANSGFVSAELTDGNMYLQHAFSPGVPVSSLVSAEWTWWADITDGPISWVGWTYTDGSASGNLFFSNDMGPWVTLSLLGWLDPNKTLSSVQIYGYSGGGATPDVVRLDDMAFCY